MLGVDLPLKNSFSIQTKMKIMTYNYSLTTVFFENIMQVQNEIKSFTETAINRS